MSHCNEQIFKFSQQDLLLPVKPQQKVQQQHLQQPHQQSTLIKRDSQRSLIIEPPQASNNNTQWAIFNQKFASLAICFANFAQVGFFADET